MVMMSPHEYALLLNVAVTALYWAVCYKDVPISARNAAPQLALLVAAMTGGFLWLAIIVVAILAITVTAVGKGCQELALWWSNKFKPVE